MLLNKFKVYEDYRVFVEVLSKIYYKSGIRLAMELIAKNKVKQNENDEDIPSSLRVKIEEAANYKITIGVYDEYNQPVAKITFIPSNKYERELFTEIKGVLINTADDRFIYLYIITDRNVAGIAVEEVKDQFILDGVVEFDENERREEAW